MSSKAQDQPASGLFEIKAGSVNLLNLRLLEGDTDGIVEQLGDKVRKAPEFFRNAPIVIDLGGLQEGDSHLDFAALFRQLRSMGLSPVGVRGGDQNAQRAAEQAGLAVLPEMRPDPGPGAKEVGKPVVEPPPSRSATKLIDAPVRSGQRIYAAGGDLIVLAPVSPGAELMADGNIHIYNSLRGRALAGVQGNLESRIYCLDLQAELIAIGGRYQISENLEESIRGRPVQVFLRDDALIIEDL